eukprot:1360405-Amorphochlora_amoeboformis.AAC.1
MKFAGKNIPQLKIRHQRIAHAQAQEKARQVRNLVRTTHNVRYSSRVNKQAAIEKAQAKKSGKNKKKGRKGKKKR